LTLLNLVIETLNRLLEEYNCDA